MIHNKIAQYIEYQIPFIFDSGNTSTSQTTTDDGSGFSVSLETPLLVPEEAKYCWITVYNATIWNNVFNINENVNDQISVDFDDGGGLITRVFTVLPGLYDLNHLNASIQREISNSGWPSDLLVLEPDTSTDKVVIRFNYIDTQVDFTAVRDMRVVLGFDARLVPLALTTIAPQFEYGDVQAQFNNINYFIIHSDLVLRGQRINERYQQAIALVNITEKPGSQINYLPQIVPRIPSNELIGAKQKTIAFWLTDNNNVRVDTNNQTWSVSLVVHYIAPTRE